jgi:hypothetical protein
MKSNHLFRLMNRLVIVSELTLVLLISTSESFSQKATDFSGKWILDNSKSSPVYATLASTLIITQKTNGIEFDLTILPKSGQKLSMHEKYVIGTSSGEITADKNISKEASWSADKKTLSISEVVTYNEDGITKKSTKTKTYSMSDDGMTMTVKSDDQLPEGSPTPENERHTVMVYNKSTQ